MEANSTLLYVKEEKGENMTNIEEKVENLIKSTIENIGYKLYDVQYVKEGQNYFLRVFIEKQNGSVDLNDCEKVNDAINDLLDTANYIKDQYFLEVSSTGLEKVLRRDKHLEDNIGNEVHVNLFTSLEITQNGNKKNKRIKDLQGILEEVNKNSITLKLDGNEKIKIERRNISLIKTVFDWESI